MAALIELIWIPVVSESEFYFLIEFLVTGIKVKKKDHRNLERELGVFKVSTRYPELLAHT